MGVLKTIEINGKAIKYYPSMHELCYVYCLICPVTQLPFYVGRTTNKDLRIRLAGHCSSKNPNKKLGEKIAWIKEQGLEPEIKLVVTSDYLQHEQEIIKEYSQKYELLNIQTSHQAPRKRSLKTEL